MSLRLRDIPGATLFCAAVLLEWAVMSALGHNPGFVFGRSGR